MCCLVFKKKILTDFLKDEKVFIFQYKDEENKYELKLNGILDNLKGMKFFSINKTPHFHHKMSKELF